MRSHRAHLTVAVLLWFAGLAMVLVAVVFDSPNLDYRIVIAGAVLPSVEALAGSAWIGHTLAGPVAAFGLVALAGRGRRLVQRRWVGLPIGWFMHLVLDGTWTETDRFWWPVTGWEFSGTAPEADRSVGLIVAMELLGAAVLFWGSRRFGLRTVGALKRFAASGHLPPAVRAR